jgi:predicted RNA binding protein YcfA (HicA-like mRNA interferase family)
MRAISGKEICKALDKRGWTWVKTKSGHRKYRSPDGQRTTVVPYHGNKSIGPGLKAAILKQTGLTEDDL